MRQSDQNKLHMFKEKSMTAENWIMDHARIIMPAVLAVCVLITVFFAINAHRKDAKEKDAEIAAAVAQEETVSAEDAGAPVYELEENAYPEVNDIVRAYYNAQASGDVDTISEMNSYLNDLGKIHVEVMSKYIENYPVLEVYTKPGLSENTYVAYVYSKVKFTDVEQEVPGMKTYYIGQRDDGSFFVNDGDYNSTITNYIKEVTLQDDVVDLNNKVVVEYNELLANDDEVNEFIAYLKDKINEEVGEILAQAEEAENEQEAEAVETASLENEENAGENAVVIQTVKTTDVVNIRTSDSETADRIDRAQVGQEFKLLEQRGNGWSKVEYNNGEAYIKSDYLEVVSEATADEGNSGTQAASSNDTVSGTVTVKTTVRVRKSASTDADVLGTVYEGDKLDLVMKQADGWTKVKYKGDIAYVKSDYVE